MTPKELPEIPVPDPDDLDDEEAEEIHARDIWRIARFLAPYARAHARPLGLLGLVLLVETVVNFSFPLATQYLIDEGLLLRNSDALIAVLVFLGCAAVIAAG